ncbi:MAG: hypothetical protein ACRENJ_07065 [Candidatus Eiseniibacteriota bacterium]
MTAGAKRPALEHGRLAVPGAGKLGEALIRGLIEADVVRATQRAKELLES